MRSRAAASMLRTAGFRTAHSMGGGINAWQGLTAAGPPEAGMAFFPADAAAEQLIALAWLLEDGSRMFYASVASLLRDIEPQRLFSDLTSAEEHHKESLAALYQDLSGKAPAAGFPRDILQAGADEDRMEGAVKVSEALAWARDREPRDVLDLSLALETDSYDLYIKMSRAVTDERAQRVFSHLIREEKEHLARMAALLDRMV
jgi:rubrerythrin